MKKNQTKTEYGASLAAAVIADFEQRKTARKPFELQWQLNIDFYRGLQNNYITSFETFGLAGKQYYWQEREVFNHISPMVEARLAKLALARPVADVVPSTDAQDDADCALVCKKIIKSTFQRAGLDALVESANMWCELTGSAFFKVLWNRRGGRLVGEVKGEPVYEGDVEIVVCSPFEIYPDSLTATDVGECRSIIHARAYKASDIKEIWGVCVLGQDVDVFDLATASTNKKNARSVMQDAAVVVERYEMPSSSLPNGRLVIAAGDKLLFSGELPYINMAGGKRGLPFVRQCSESIAGSFFGKSVIERAIPVQRAYNSIKNRKTEFLNRLACGVMSVEDGSVDLESLESEGLCPGKVIVYRQGMREPKFIDGGSMPAELEREEERLMSEFAAITGSTPLAREESIASMSGVALQVLFEQENNRMSRAVNSMLRAVAVVAAQVLRLYKQFAVAGRLERLAEGGDVEMFYWNAAEITSDEVVVNSARDVADTPAAKRLVILELLKSGILADEDGRISNERRARILSMIGLGEI